MYWHIGGVTVSDAPREADSAGSNPTRRVFPWIFFFLPPKFFPFCRVSYNSSCLLVEGAHSKSDLLWCISLLLHQNSKKGGGRGKSKRPNLLRNRTVGGPGRLSPGRGPETGVGGSPLTHRGRGCCGRSCHRGLGPAGGLWVPVGPRRPALHCSQPRGSMHLKPGPGPKAGPCRAAPPFSELRPEEPSYGRTAVPNPQPSHTKPAAEVGREVRNGGSRHSS